MPRFGPEKISDEELEMIADYIESLAPVAEHQEPLAMEDALVVHHWMAFYALDSGNKAEAEHHVSHILELVTDPEHKAQMEEALGRLRAGDLHDASHAIENMLAGKAAPELPLENMHLQLALTALETRDVEEAKHHLQHFVDLATGDEKAQGEKAIGLLEQGNIHDAEHEVEGLLE
jgi:thioredoxin-like negative regulator of GroEL